MIEGMTGNQQFMVNITSALGTVALGVGTLYTAWNGRKIRQHQILNAAKNNADNAEIKAIGATVIEKTEIISAQTGGITAQLIERAGTDGEAKGEQKEKAAQFDRNVARDKQTDEASARLRGK